MLKEPLKGPVINYGEWGGGGGYKNGSSNFAEDMLKGVGHNKFWFSFNR